MNRSKSLVLTAAALLLAFAGGLLLGSQQRQDAPAVDVPVAGPSNNPSDPGTTQSRQDDVIDELLQRFGQGALQGVDIANVRIGEHDSPELPWEYLGAQNTLTVEVQEAWFEESGTDFRNALASQVAPTLPEQLQSGNAADILAHSLTYATVSGDQSTTETVQPPAAVQAILSSAELARFSAQATGDLVVVYLGKTSATTLELLQIVTAIAQSAPVVVVLDEASNPDLGSKIREITSNFPVSLGTEVASLAGQAKALMAGVAAFVDGQSTTWWDAVS